jgi:molybdopterin-binding protein
MTRNKKSTAVGLTLTLLVSALAGCSGAAKTTKGTNPMPGVSDLSGKDIDKKKAAAQAPEQAILAGKVVETINAGSYTYLRLEKDGKRAWAAVPAVEVAVGEEVELIPGIDMGQFTSTSLKRTFESIHFSAGIKQPAGKTAALPTGHPKTTPATATALPPGHPKTDAAAKTAPVAVPAASLITGKVVETTNAAGYTYICLEKGGKKTWAAIPATEVSVGSEMSILPGSEMTDFNSPSLKRSFEKIVFSPGAAAK